MVCCVVASRRAAEPEPVCSKVLPLDRAGIAVSSSCSPLPLRAASRPSQFAQLVSPPCSTVIVNHHLVAGPSVARCSCLTRSATRKAPVSASDTQQALPVAIAQWRQPDAPLTASTSPLLPPQPFFLQHRCHVVQRHCRYVYC